MIVRCECGHLPFDHNYDVEYGEITDCQFCDCELYLQPKEPTNGGIMEQRNESGQAFPGGNIVWLIVGILAIIALFIWIAPHIN